VRSVFPVHGVYAESSRENGITAQQAHVWSAVVNDRGQRQTIKVCA